MSTTPTVPSAPGGLSLQNFGSYLRGVREELKKATWPTRTELIRLTQVVLVVIAVTATYCGTLDFLFGLVTSRLLSK